MSKFRRVLLWVGVGLVVPLILGVSYFFIVPKGGGKSVSSTPSVSSSPTTKASVELPEATDFNRNVVVAQATPTRLYFPSIAHMVEVAELPAANSDPISPPKTAEGMSQAYWDPMPLKTKQDGSFAPGSTTADLSVIAGHTSSSGEAVFNSLYGSAGSTVKPGQEVWLQTVATGTDRWMVYNLEKVHTPKQGAGEGSLESSTEIWGTDESPRPDTLLLIGCIQEEGGGSVRNFVYELSYAGVRDAKNTQ